MIVADPTQSQAFLESLIAAMPVGVAVHDPHGRCILANDAAVALAPAVTSDMSAAALADLRAPGVSVSKVDGRAVELQSRTLQSETGRYCVTTLLDVTQHCELQRELLESAYVDALTQLPNRNLLEQHVEELIANLAPKDRFALAFIDLDNFKYINDYFGHSVGDSLLRKVGDRIAGAIGRTDMLARVGGDEFVLLMAPIGTRGDLAAAIDDISHRLKQPNFIDGHEIFTSASIGVSVFPDHGDSYDVLRRNADNAMYRVKGGVKGGVKFFEDTMARAATARMEVEQRLRLAIRDRCFCCAFQPKVELRTGEVRGVEVLLRWRDEEGVIQAPGDFVGLAVELGLINDITNLVLAETMRSIHDLDEIFGPHITISLNIAAKQACDVAFMEAFCASLADTGCAERFILELTEEAFLTKGRFQTEVLPRIRSVGAKVSIDDFGVGYSSLAALAEITADELKIDRSFIFGIHERPRTQIVLKAIEALGHALGMSIVAEGVESHEEALYLQAATQIRQAQGYYFARPMLIEQIRTAKAHDTGSREIAKPRIAPSTRFQVVRSR